MLPLAIAGCTGKSKAEAKAHAAFLAGQQQAMSRMYDLDRTGIRVIGPVQNPLVAWTQDLTLAGAIVAAGYLGARDPREIIIVREGQPIRVNPRQLLQGWDMPLQPADILELRP
jgi:hypothetical protein